MANNGSGSRRGDDGVGVTPSRWRFFRPLVGTPLAAAGSMSIRSVLNRLNASVDASGTRPVVPLGHGDPTSSACFRTAPEAEDAVVDALRSRKHNGYSPTVGVPQARSAIAEYLSRDLPYELSPDDIYLTSGCVQAIEIMISVLAQPGANILLPKPGFPMYESRTTFSELEIAETAGELGILIIADEVYDHLAFGDKPFIPMGVFGKTAPVITLGAISKRWLVPGWRLGWIATCDPNGILKETKVDQSIQNYINITSDPATFIQGAVPQIIANTKEEYFNKILDLLRTSADLCYGKIKGIRGITCPHKPEGSMFVMAKLDLSCLDGFSDDIDFCCKLAKEESVIVLPGSALGMKDWLRITFAIDLVSLEDGLERLNSFCERHAKV
ncbi:putative aminotransferase TAT2 [Hordeum vulgare]|nr:putative aminotransferase TAT2 [Hordeum vulgare]